GALRRNTPLLRRRQVPRLHRLPVPPEQVADLGQQLLVLGQRRQGFGRPLLPEPVDPAQELDHEEEQHQGHYEEGYHFPQELAEGDGGIADLDHPVLVPAPGQDEADQWHEDVLDQGVDDFAEGRPDNDGDGQVDDVALEREGLELLQQREGLLRRVQGGHFLDVHGNLGQHKGRGWGYAHTGTSFAAACPDPPCGSPARRVRWARASLTCTRKADSNSFPDSSSGVNWSRASVFSRLSCPWSARNWGRDPGRPRSTWPACSSMRATCLM